VKNIYNLFKMSQEESVIFWEVIVPVILGKNFTCPVPNSFRDRAISLYSSKMVVKKEILRTVSNTGIYCSSYKLAQFTLYNTISKISPSASMHFANRVRTWRVALLSETVRNKTHIFMTMKGNMTSRNTDSSSWDILYKAKGGSASRRI
jgi:hypothetical protein